MASWPADIAEMSMERTGIITKRGKPLTLVGSDLGVGEPAPDFTVIDRDGKEVKLSQYGRTIKVISVTPSLDTPVCDLQLRRFNSEAAQMPADVVVLNISMDLPYAIQRFCETAGIERVSALSDHRDASFGNGFGVLIKELRLLARSVFILDRDNVVRYAEIVPEMTDTPDFDGALRMLKILTVMPKVA
jgi:thiol peroxidase